MEENDGILMDEYEHRATPYDVPVSFPWLANSIVTQVELLMRLWPAMPYGDRARLLNDISDVLRCP